MTRPEDRQTLPRGASPSSAATATDRIDQFELRGVLGVGGMGIVYDAYDTTLGRRVALKVARSEVESSALHREGLALAAIHHPGLPLVHATGKYGTSTYLVLEAIGGASLDRRIDDARKNGNPLPIPEILGVLRRLADVLSSVHAAGVVHRDVKASNVMISGSRVVLIDFGVMVPENEIAAGLTVAGTVSSMAPEQIRNVVRSGSGPRVDLYALGVLGFEMLTLQVPFEADSADEVLAAHQTAPIPDVRTLRPDTPDALAELVTDLMAKDPDDRPDSAEVVVWRLDEILSAERPRPWRAMLVDDDVVLCSALQKSLERAFPSLSVVSYTSPRVALAELERDPPDLLFTDLNMPEINGIELAMRALALAEDRRPTVVAMSAQATANDEMVLDSLGALTLVQKDTTFIERVSAIVGKLRRR